MRGRVPDAFRGRGGAKLEGFVAHAGRVVGDTGRIDVVEQEGAGGAVERETGLELVRAPRVLDRAFDRRGADGVVVAQRRERAPDDAGRVCIRMNAHAIQRRVVVAEAIPAAT